MEDTLLDSFYDEELQALEDARAEFEDAVKKNEKRVYTLDLIMSPVLDMLDSNEESMALYLKYIEYLKTFDLEAAYDSEVAMDNKCGFKNYIVIATASLCESHFNKELSLEIIDVVSSLNRWKEKVVGLLYLSMPSADVFDDLFSKILTKASEIKESVNYDTRYERYIEMLDVFPAEVSHNPSEKDIQLIKEAVNLLFEARKANVQERVRLLSSNKLAWKVRFQEIAIQMPSEGFEVGSDLEEEYNAWMQL